METTNIQNQNPEQDEKFLVEIISEILAKNGIQETVEDAFEKIEADEVSKILTVSSIAKRINLKKLLEKDLVNTIQKELEITKETAEKLAVDIKTTIIPKSKKLLPAEGEIKKPPVLINNRAESPSPVKKAVPATAENPTISKKMPRPVKKVEGIKKSSVLPEKPEEKEQPQKMGSGDSDKYREPIK